MAARPVLIVEDEEDIRSGLAELLRDEGHVVYTAANGKVALELLRTMARPCVVLLDLLMPEMDGHEFLRHLDGDDDLITIPVLVLSATATTGELQRPFLKKPFDLDAVVHAVDEYCSH